jgi:hypothetical protein
MEIVKTCLWTKDVGVKFSLFLTLPAVPAAKKCVTCGVGKGKFHHPNCPEEICPKCGGQLLFCNCIEYGKE